MPERENLNCKRKMTMSLKKNNEVETEVVETQAAEASAAEDVLEAEVQVANDEPAIPAVSNAAPPAVAQSSQSAVVGELASSGFEGLEIDWTSFPTVVLNQGEFETSDGNSLGVDAFSVRLMQSRKRFVLRTKVANDDDAELAYTYDLAELDNPESELTQKVLKWKEEDGLDYDVKDYIEAIAMVEDADCSLDQQMVLIQIPPTSIGRFSGFTTQNLLIKKQAPSEYLTRCFKGEKVTKAKKPFYPWAFEYVAG